MADADLNVDDTQIEGVEAIEGASVEEQQRQAVTVEDLARRYGWRPQDEFKGDAADWRDAETFVDVGLNRNRDMGRDLKRLREQTETIARTTGEITSRAVEQARAEERARWEAKHDQAVEAGDTRAAREAVGKITELSTPAPKQDGPDPEVATFARENPWFNSDPDAQALAISTSNRLSHLPVVEQLKAAKEAVHKRFPEYAPAPAKPAPSVAAPASRASPTAGRRRGFSDLPSAAQQVARDLKTRGYVNSVDDYAEQYWAGQKA